MIGDPRRQAMTMLAQLLFVEINPGLFLFLLGRRCRRGRRLGDREGESTAARDIHHGQGRNLQPPFGPTGAAVEEVPQPERLFATLRNKRGILRRDQFRVRVERRRHDPLMKVWPVKGAPELSRDRALRVVTVATQIAKVDAAPQGQDCGEQHGKKLALWLTHRRHLLQNIVDNCHRPCS